MGLRIGLKDGKEPPLCPVRCTSNPNHHLWCNHGVWFLHHTIYPTLWTKERQRFTLKTRSLDEARTRRDDYFRILGETGDPEAARFGCVARSLPEAQGILAGNT